jgi:hypothetical protein
VVLREIERCDEEEEDERRKGVRNIELVDRDR